jgi:chromosome segregation ATPase
MARTIRQIATLSNHPDPIGATEMTKHRNTPGRGNGHPAAETSPTKSLHIREPLPGVLELACRMSQDITDAADRAVGVEVKQLADNLETLIQLIGDNLETLLASRAETLGVMRDQLTAIGQGLTQTREAVTRGVGDLDLRVADIRAEVGDLRQQCATWPEQITATLTGLQGCGQRLERLEAASGEVRSALAGNRESLTDLTAAVYELHADLATIRESYQGLAQMVRSLSATVATALDQQSRARVEEAERPAPLISRMYRDLGRLFSWLMHRLAP